MKKSVLGAMLAVPFMFAQPIMAGPAAAEVMHYELESPHTQILFFVNHLGFSNSQGEFLKYEGQFTLDTDNPENSSASATIHVNSLDMGHDVWKEHVESEKFFNAAQYPEITFKSTSVEMTGEKTARVTGDLTMLGQTRPVVLDATLNKAGTHPMSGKEVAGLSAVGTIKREDWGMTYALPAIGNDIELRIEVEGIRQPAQ